MRDFTKEELMNAFRIPALGHGGNEIWEELINLGAQVPKDQSIVEFGPFLGSATAFASLATEATDYHAYDLWRADSVFKDRAKKFLGLDFKPGEDLFPYFQKNVPSWITPHKISIDKATWTKAPIGLLVDDCCNLKETFDVMVKEFYPSLVPGATVVLMDYFFYETKTEIGYTKRFMNANAEYFQFISRPRAFGPFAIFKLIKQPAKTFIFPKE